MTNKRIHMLSIEKEKLVIDLYYNQRKNVRQIAQEARISFRDISAIIKKKEAAVNNDGGSGNGSRTEVVDNQQLKNDNNKSPSQKATHAYRLFSEDKKPFEVAIELGIRGGSSKQVL
jgi:hypothetical protein